MRFVFGVLIFRLYRGYWEFGLRSRIEGLGRRRLLDVATIARQRLATRCAKGRQIIESVVQNLVE